MATSSTQPPPPISWQILELIANILDPKTLATASCVSKPWSAAMSSDHLWEHLCTTHFPSLTHLRSAAVPPLRYRHLYNLSHTAMKRRQLPPSKPKITLQDLLFIITLKNSNSSPLTLIKHCSPISPEYSKPLFRFDFDLRDNNSKWLNFEVMDETKVTWNVALMTSSPGLQFDGVFTMMDCKGKGCFVSGSDGWFSSELPAAGCGCATGCGGGSSGMVADMRLVIREENNKMVVGGLSVGVLSIVSWRYVGVDDGLRYLQHFLQP